MLSSFLLILFILLGLFIVACDTPVDDESPGSGPSAEPAPEPDPEPAPDPDPTPSPTPNPGFPPPPALSSAKAITGFTVTGQIGESDIDAKNKTVTVTVPYNTDRTSLTPAITISPRAAIDPASDKAQDFSNDPVPYTVTAENGSKAVWKVTVALGLSPKAEITAFTVAGVAGNIVADTITVTLPWGTPLNPTIAISAKAAVSPLSGETRKLVINDGGSFDPVTYTVTAEDGTPVEWTVTVTWAPLAESGDIAESIKNYLDNIPSDVGTETNPVFLPVKIDNLADGTNGLAALLGAINKFVALDLSDSKGMTEFDPDNTTSIGEDKIVSLVLPDTAESVKLGTYSDPTFKNFSALTSVTGKYVEIIGEYAFQDCNALKTVTLPEAKTIDRGAFYGCTSLTAVSLPSATYIKANAFAYTGTTDLTVTLGAAVPKLDPELFVYAGQVDGKNVTVKVPSDATGYASTLPATFTGSLTAGGPYWGEGFRGNGWNGSSAYVNGDNVNTKISLTIKKEGAS